MRASPLETSYQAQLDSPAAQPAEEQTPESRWSPQSPSPQSGILPGLRAVYLVSYGSTHVPYVSGKQVAMNQST